MNASAHDAAYAAIHKLASQFQRKDPSLTPSAALARALETSDGQALRRAMTIAKRATAMTTAKRATARGAEEALRKRARELASADPEREERLISA